MWSENFVTIVSSTIPASSFKIKLRQEFYSGLSPIIFFYNHNKIKKNKNLNYFYTFYITNDKFINELYSVLSENSKKYQE